MVVPLSVVADHEGVVGVVEAAGQGQHVEVVELMVVCYPGPDEPPESLKGWVGSETGHLLLFSSYRPRLSQGCVQLTEHRSIPQVSGGKPLGEGGVVLLVQV